MLIVVTSAISVLAQSDDKSQQKITLELKDTPIRSALDTLFKGRGLNYVIDPTVGGNVGSLSLRDVPFDVALKMLLKSVDPPLVYRKEGDVYLISVKKEQVYTDVPPTTTDIPTTDTEAEDVKMEKITLNFVDAYDLKAIIEGQNTTRNSGSSSFGSGSSSGSSSFGSGSSGFNNSSNNYYSNTNSSSSNHGRYNTRSSY